jgi:hypothetical protein
VNLYARIAGSQFGSSILFGGVIFVSTFMADGPAAAASAGAFAATAWLGIVPLVKRLSGGELA